jgi:hypothetical protein
MATANKAKRKKSDDSNGAVNKAEEIRKAAKALGGKKVRPRDVITALAEKGITVSSPQVSSTLKAAGYRRTRRTKGAASPKASGGQAPGQLSLHDLLAAKALIGKVGSVEAAKRAIDALAKLA